MPVDGSRHLLDWSHAMVKMYEFDTTEEQALAANTAAEAFRDFTRSSSFPSGGAHRAEDLVSGLVQARVDGKHLSDAEIVLHRHRPPERRGDGYARSGGSSQSRLQRSTSQNAAQRGSSASALNSRRFRHAGSSARVACHGGMRERRRGG